MPYTLRIFVGGTSHRREFDTIEELAREYIETPGDHYPQVLDPDGVTIVQGTDPLAWANACQLDAEYYLRLARESKRDHQPNAVIQWTRRARSNNHMSIRARAFQRVCWKVFIETL